MFLVACQTPQPSSKPPVPKDSGATSPGEIKITTERIESGSASADFNFKNVPKAARNDAATAAQFTLVDGTQDPNGGGLEKLHDGQLPRREDQPSQNFFFAQRTDGGRILLDLGKEITIKQVNSYSCHPGSRGPQVYVLFGSDGKGANFNPQPKKGAGPEQCGWKLIAKVDTRQTGADNGGAHGVSISRSTGPIGQYRYLLFDIFRAEDADVFGNTFYSEIDVIDQNGPALEFAEAPAALPRKQEIVEAENAKYKITIDTTETPDLTDWAHKELAPVVQEWCPRLVKMLPSEGFEAPTKLSIAFSADMQGVAATGGNRINCAAKWMRANLKGEAVGSIVHEMAHVVQQYGRRRSNPNATRVPGWLTEGLTDYIRWYKYEPQSHGAEITKRNLARARYDASYRVTANFLNWVTEKYDAELIRKLNAAAREGRYSEALWKELTGNSLQDLGAAWKTDLEKKLGPQ